MTERILFVPFDHLNRDRGVLATAKPDRDLIVLVESERMVSGRDWHPQRLFFLISSARHVAEDLRERGFDVRYERAPTTVDGIDRVRADLPGVPVECAEPSSFRQFRQLREAGVVFAPNDLFLTPRTLFADWAGSQKSFVMENFYRAQRVRLGVLVDGAAPEGGRWNFDAENRLPPPKNYDWPAYLDHERDAIDREVAADLNVEPSPTWATTRDGALRQLDHFIAHHLAGFGPLEDAMVADNWAMHHSLLAPYLNNGLLDPRECVDAAIRAYRSGSAPLESVEGFVRQIIGWREYVNGMYWYLGEEYRDLNELNADLDLLPVFRDSTRTRMNCVRSVVGAVEERAWTHHIPRLMVLSNLALVTGVNPGQFLDWMRERFIDAADWVMVPNVIGMGVHADGGVLMTKPYASGGAYIKRMSQFCGECPFNPTKRVGDDACPFTTLYWDFLDRHRDEFARNHRMAQQIAGIDRLGDIAEVRDRAAVVRDGLVRGTL